MYCPEALEPTVPEISKLADEARIDQHIKLPVLPPRWIPDTQIHVILCPHKVACLPEAAVDARSSSFAFPREPWSCLVAVSCLVPLQVSEQHPVKQARA